jgi:hypothetical protein
MNVHLQPALEDEKPPAPSKGVEVARASRSECNALGNKDRAALMGRAMNLIYGTNGPQIPDRRR